MWSVITGFKRHDDWRMPCQFFGGENLWGGAMGWGMQSLLKGKNQPTT
jgi:hypothetical protein